MKTDVIRVSSQGDGLEAALEQVEKVAAYKGLSSKQSLQLRLLTEEMMGMMRSLTGEAQGKFWIEDEDSEYRLHLWVLTRMTSVKREELLAASTSGKNAAVKGLMSRLRDFFDRGADQDVSYANPLMLAGMYEQSTPSMNLEWSMTRYQSLLLSQVENRADGAREAWDELEKSVVAHVADDVRVAINGGEVEMTIVKKMA